MSKPRTIHFGKEHKEELEKILGEKLPELNNNKKMKCYKCKKKIGLFIDRAMHNYILDDFEIKLCSECNIEFMDYMNSIMQKEIKKYFNIKKDDLEDDKETI